MVGCFPWRAREDKLAQRSEHFDSKGGITPALFFAQINPAKNAAAQNYSMAREKKFLEAARTLKNL
jgi:hypothetical protein